MATEPGPNCTAKKKEENKINIDSNGIAQVDVKHSTHNRRVRVVDNIFFFRFSS